MDDKTAKDKGPRHPQDAVSGSQGANLDQQRRAFVSKLVDRIATDPALRQALVDNNQAALDASGLGAENEALTAAYEKLPESERGKHHSHGLCTWFLAQTGR
jgi:hypothetical protein